MKYARWSVLAVSLAATPVLAGDFDISLTNNSVKGQVNFFNNRSDIQVATGYTYREGRRHIGNLDFYAQGRTAIGNLPTTAGVGFRGLGWSQRSLDGGALMVGGLATVNLPDVPGLSLQGGAHFAPRILSFGDSDRVISVETRVAYRLIPNAEVSAGYRYLNTRLDNAPRKHLNLDEGVLAGLRIFF